jgi:hypothetical protein
LHKQQCNFCRPTDILKGRLREALSQREEQCSNQLEAGLKALERLDIHGQTKDDFKEDDTKGNTQPEGDKKSQPQLEVCGNGLHSQKEGKNGHAQLKTVDSDLQNSRTKDTSGQDQLRTDAKEIARSNQDKNEDEECLTIDLAKERLNEDKSKEEKCQLEAGLQALDSFIIMTGQNGPGPKTQERLNLSVPGFNASNPTNEKGGEKKDDKLTRHVDIGLKSLGKLDLDSLRETEIIDEDTSASSVISGEYL